MLTFVTVKRDAVGLGVFGHLEADARAEVTGAAQEPRLASLVEARSVVLREGVVALESIAGISAKVLTENLRKLEEDGVVKHDDELYTVTESGQKLMEPLHALGQWAEQHAH